MNTHLRPVREDGTTDTAPTEAAGETPSSGIPKFEGQDVDFTRIRLSAAGDLEVNGVSRIDDIVRLYVEGRVVRVDHVVDERTGKMKRVQTVKVVDALQLPWDFDASYLDIEP